MATPNMPSSAQDIINNFLSGGYASEAIANPYRVDVDPFRPPVSDTPEDDKSPTDPCPEGYVYDPVIKSCVPIEQESGDRPDEPDREKMMFEQMKKDPSTVFGASNILDDYLIDSKGGDILLRFDPNIGKLGAGAINPLMVLGGGLLDSVFGGPKRREDRFNDALQTFTDSGYGQQLNSGTYKVFNPQQYYNSVQGNPLGSYQLTTSGGYLGEPTTYGVQTSPITVGEAIDSVINRTDRPTAQGIGSGKIAEDLTGGLLGTSPLTSVDSSGNRVRNDDVYRSNIAKNIERNKRNFGNARFKEGFGFTGGR